MGTEFEARKAALRKAGEWYRNKRTIKCLFGNIYEKLTGNQARVVTVNGVRKRLENRWSMFAMLEADNASTDGILKSVTYHLNPTFRNAVNKVT